MTCLWGLILRSFDLLLLRRVYVLTAACIQSPHPGRQAENEAAKHQKKSDAPLLPRFSRFLLALQLLFNVRDLSTPYAITHVAPFSQFNPSYTPSRLAFLLHHFLSFVSGYFILNILSLLPSPDPNIGIPIAQQAFFSRLQEVTLIEAFGRVSSSVIYWCAVALFIGTMHDLVGLVLVGLRISPPDLFPPIFASLSTGYSLRQFWGMTWHQLFRASLSSTAFYLSTSILRLRPHTFPSRYVRLFLTFLLSGLVHLATDLSTGVPVAESGAVRFFCMQALGIAIEDGVGRFWAVLSLKGEDATRKKEERGRENRVGWQKALGYAWVVAWFAWTTPSFTWPTGRHSRPGLDIIVPYDFLKSWR